MTAKEFESILIEGFYHVPESRVAFFKKEAKKNGIKLHNFSQGLYSAYENLNKYVNSFDYSIWGENDNGEKEYYKNTININHLTKGVHSGVLTDENIKEILPNLLELQKEVSKKLNKKMLKILTKELKNRDTKPTITGFKTTLTEPQRTNLYKALQDNYIDCTEAEFKAMFTDKPKPIKWLETKALLSFFISDLFQKRNPDKYWNKAESIFVDEAGNSITYLRQSFTTAYNNKNKQPKNYNTLKNIYSHLL